MPVNVNTTTNTIVVQNANQTITVVDNENANIVNVTQPLVNVIEVASPGPQGPVGPTGPQGPSVPFTNIGNDVYATTSSLQVTGSFLVSGSSTFTNIGPAIFSGSTAVSGSLTVNGYDVVTTNQTSSLTVSSASYADTASLAPNYVLTSSTGSMLSPYVLTNVTSSMLQPYVLTSLTSSMLQPYALTSQTSSMSVATASFAATSSFLNTLNQDLTFNGNLTLNGTASINVLQINTTINSTGSNQLGDNANDTQTLYGSVVIPTGSLVVTGSTIISSSAATQLQVGSNLLFVSSSGNVGIGTNTPFSPLTVNGVISSGNNLGASGGSTVQGELRSYQQNASPLYLSLQTSGNKSGLFRSNANYIVYYDTGNGDTVLNSGFSNANLRFTYLDSEKMRIFGPTGNVVIQNGGTFTDAGYRLDVSGSAKVNEGIFGIGTSGTILPLVNTAGTGTVVVGGTSPNTPALRLQGSPLNFFIGSTQVAQMFATTGNFALQSGGTFTDAGFRLDVSGSARVTGEANVSFLSLSGNTAVNNSGTTLILGASSGWSGVRVPRYFETTGSISAASAIARGTFLNQTLVATANNDTLVGLDIQPTFTPGAFTGVAQIGLRVAGDIVPSTDNTRVLGSSSLRFNNIYAAQSVINTMFTGNIRSNLTGGVRILANNGTQWAQWYDATGNLTLQNGGTFTDNNYRLQVNATDSTNSGSLFLGGTTIATGSIARTMLISSSLSASANNDVLVGLDINPTFNAGSFTGVERTAIRFGTIKIGLTPSGQDRIDFGNQVNISRSGEAILTGTTVQTFLSSRSSAAYLAFALNQGITEVGRFAATTGNFLINTTTDAGYRLVINSSGSLSGSLYITGSSNQTLLRVDSDASSNIMFVSGSGNVGIGTSTPTNTLDIVSTTTGSLRISGSAGSQITLVRPTAGLFGYVRYLGSSIDIGTNGTDPLRLNTNNTIRISIGETGFVGIGIGASVASALLQVRGSGTTSVTTALLVQNSTPTNLLSVLDNGQVSFTSPTMSLAASQSAFSISPIISASNIVGGQYYGVNITPTFFQTTGSQTETAFRVAATFTQSSAAATSGSNIIADFGSTSAGSQLTVTDVTSGSIYMVNDVSGIPIIEATSNWDVNIYDFPNKVFEKTGSQVNIYGTMRVSGSFILPLSQSVAPQTGSAYWSGSLLFIYDGTRYRSSSFA